MSTSCVLRDRQLLPAIYHQTVRLYRVRYHRGFALDDGFAINDQHAGIKSMSENMQHENKLEGTATNWGDRIRIKNKLEKLMKLHF